MWCVIILHLSTSRCFAAGPVGNCPDPTSTRPDADLVRVKRRRMPTSCRVIDVGSLAGGAEPADMDASAPSLSCLCACPASAVKRVRQPPTSSSLISKPLLKVSNPQIPQLIRFILSLRIPPLVIIKIPLQLLHCNSCSEFPSPPPPLQP